MIPARKSKLFTRWFVRDAEARILRTFGSIWVRGLERVAEAAKQGPILVVSNHTSWWDPLLILYLAVRVLRLDAFAMMDARNLTRLPFFGKVGAFGVDLDDPLDGARAIRYASKLLAQPGRLVWVFPQGREVPVTARPLEFQRGSAQIARVASRALVFPAAIRYEHGRGPKPSIFVSFGEPLVPERDVERANQNQETAVTTELDAIDRGLIAGDLPDAFEIYRAPSGFFAANAERALAWLTRGPEGDHPAGGSRARGPGAG